MSVIAVRFNLKIGETFEYLKENLGKLSPAIVSPQNYGFMKIYVHVSGTAMER